jgi:tetratricopeptide (TPR) repeat protein
VTTVDLASMNYYGGNFDKAIALIAPHIRDFASFEPEFEVLADAYLAKDMNEQVIFLLEEDSLSADVLRQRAIPLGIAYARLGQRRKALSMLKIAEAGNRDGYFLSVETAALYNALHERDKALDMLELAYARRESNVVFLNVDPLLASLRSEPRFVQLLNQMKMQ